MTAEIKRGGLKDLQRIQELNQRVFQEFWEDPYSLQKYFQKLNGKDPLILLVEESVIIGDLIAFNKQDSFYIWLMAVEKRFRRRGVGSRLLEECESFARQHDFPSLSVKVYNISSAMQRLLIKRKYLITGFTKSDDDRYNKTFFTLFLQ